KRLLSPLNDVISIDHPPTNRAARMKTARLNNTQSNPAHIRKLQQQAVSVVHDLGIVLNLDHDALTVFEIRDRKEAFVDRGAVNGPVKERVIRCTNPMLNENDRTLNHKRSNGV